MILSGLLFEAVSTALKNAKWSGFQIAKSCFCLNSRFQHVKHYNLSRVKTQTVNEDVFMTTREDVLLEEVSRCSLYLG